jgi:hypothetical protein
LFRSLFRRVPRVPQAVAFAASARSTIPPQPLQLGSVEIADGLDAKTGRLLSYVQPIKGDFHDWDLAAAPVLQFLPAL